MEPTKKLGKYAVAAKGRDGIVIGHLPLGKSGKFAKTVFYFFKSDKNHYCRITVTGKATNASYALGMKVQCQLYFLAKEEFIIIFQEKLNKFLQSFKIYIEI